MESIITINFEDMNKKDRINLSNNFIKRNKNKIKIICNNKIKSIETQLLKEKIKLKFLLLETNLFFYQLYDMKYNVNNYFIIDEKKSKEESCIKNKDKIRIFGKEFVEKNKFKCLILYKNEILPLKEYLSVKEIRNYLILKLIVFEKIYHLSYLFEKCYSLEKFESITKKDVTIVEKNNEPISENVNINDEGNNDEFYENIKQF